MKVRSQLLHSASSGGELWNVNYTSEITTLNQRCQALVLSDQSVIGYRLSRGKCKIPRVKQLWCPRSVLQKSSVQAVSSKVQSWPWAYRAGERDPRGSKRRPFSESITVAKYGIQQLYKGLTLTKKSVKLVNFSQRGI